MPPHQGGKSILVALANKPAKQVSIGLGIGGANQAVELVQQLRMAYRHGPFLVWLSKVLY